MPICAGASLALTGTSLQGINGSWSPLPNNTATTTYTFTPTVGECADPTTLIVTVNPTPLTPTGNSPQAVVNGSTIADLVVSPTSVIWYANAQDAQDAVNPLPTSTVLINGSSYYAVNSANGCNSSPFEVAVQFTAGLSEDKSIINFTIYPNPTSIEVIITGLESGTGITLLDATGRVIKQFKARSNQESLDVTNYTMGVYFVQIQTTSGVTSTKKLIVRK